MMRVFLSRDALSPEQKTFFDNWLEEARNARAASDGKTFDTNIWRLLKIWLLKNFFYGKCAYCEVNVAAGDVGDAEHYRPKGAVTELRGRRFVPVEKEGVRHGGYAWLAYDWENLIPSCRNCNAVRGKRTQFPIRGIRVWCEQEAPDTTKANAIEQPLLLHPYDRSRDPRDHIVYTPDGGVEGIDDIGKATIEVLNLDRDALVEARQIHLRLARKAFGLDLGNVVANDNMQDISAGIDHIESQLAAPNVPFSSAIRDLIRALRARVAPQAANTNAPLGPAGTNTGVH